MNVLKKEKYSIYDSEYKSSYLRRDRTSIKKFHLAQKYENPIIQDCKQYLVTTFSNKDDLEENPNCYREKLMKKVEKKIAERYFEKPIDEQLYYKEYLKKWKSQSATDFAMKSPHEDMTAVELLRCLLKLPDDSHIAFTSSASHYKNPTSYVPMVYQHRTTPIRTNPTVDLTVPNLYRKIEVSEYTDKICDHAEYFLEYQLKKKKNNHSA